MSIDTLIKNVRIVRPGHSELESKDIGIKNGRFCELGEDISTEKANIVVDGKNQLAFPGLVDAHMHVGIYSPLEEDAASESKAAAMG